MRPLLFALAVAAAPVAGLAETWRGTPEVPHTVEQEADGIEIRSYPPRTVAEVTVQGERPAAARRGFVELFDYINGENAAQGKIAMTVPVDQTRTDRGWTLRFFMPEGANIDSLPAPESAHVALRRLPAERMLVTRFSGRPTPARLSSAEAALRAHAAERGLATVGAPRLMFYDGPFTPPWSRRNEIGLVLAR
ncbi:SOUL family heme-binding protein [Rhodovulum steppense]|uniref:SOUL heme-binding protein n=1 Tax=Rhodovulum steppense TaxID=540251 RepID=A0A4R1YL08_9RHOB|nr:heme-binding protein [Rhodovulum steppense]TCM77803.1 SOUL heme-binding protein [Rhodovulum steppense]